MISYDTNIVIYALEGVDPWSKAAVSIIESGESEGAVVSVLLWQEMFGAVRVIDSSVIDELAQALKTLQSTQFVDVSMSIAELAVKLNKKYGNRLRSYDAIHIATAIEHKADYFVTNDQILVRLNISEIEIRPLK